MTPKEKLEETITLIMVQVSEDEIKTILEFIDRCSLSDFENLKEIAYDI